jgi:RimJ/RimL family protein N-acetyltransferase
MGETTVIIRPVQVTDAADYLKLSQKIDESNFMLYEPGEKKTTVEQQQMVIEKILSQNKSTLFVAESDDRLVGFISALGGNLKRNQHSAYLVLGVLEEYQGKGIATQLINQICAWAKEKEISRLELTVIKTNFKAFNLYRKMGFVLEGEKVNSLIINGEPVNEYYLYKLL